MNILLLILLMSVSSQAEVAQTTESLRLMSLNMHGYHPMGESTRFVESQGSIQSVDSQLHYFDWSELVRGNQRRILSPSFKPYR